MIDLLGRLSGFASVRMERLLESFLHSKERLEQLKGTAVHDGTGLLVREAVPIPTLWRDEEILYPGYPSPAHSLWRAQEMSLFLQHRAMMERPLLDFGCGDGSLGAMLFDAVDYGVDNDAQALAVAKGFPVYKNLVCCTETSIPLAERSVRTIVSNSVLEHVLQLDEILRELTRLLVPRGRLMITVPTLGFKDHLEKYFGREESERINVQYYHRNLMRVDGWRKRLEAAGLAIEGVRHYQPDWFTYNYRMLRLAGKNAFGRVIPRLHDRLWSRCGRRLLSWVRKSLTQTREGANVFIIARRPES
jgi:2-polyprenyl-3-methyl-5-hydroxy-6-metoxy-1,4-benzoquinol methylase